MPTWFYANIPALQFARFFRIAFDTTKIKDFDIYKTEPFIQHVKTKNITTVSISHIWKWHFLMNTFKRKAVFSEILNIHISQALIHKIEYTSKFINYEG